MSEAMNLAAWELGECLANDLRTPEGSKWSMAIAKSDGKGLADIADRMLAGEPSDTIREYARRCRALYELGPRVRLLNTPHGAYCASSDLVWREKAVGLTHLFGDMTVTDLRGRVVATTRLVDWSEPAEVREAAPFVAMGEE